MDTQYRYYRAEGRSLEAVRECQKMIRDRVAACAALADEVGAENAVSKFSVDGFTFAGDPPKGWKPRGKVGDKTYYAPERRRKADKDLWRRMTALRQIRGADFGEMIGRKQVMAGAEGTGYGFALLSPTFETLGETVVILIPAADKDETPPPDCVPLKTSEYWTLKEEQAAA